MVTIAQILEFAGAVTDYRRERPYTWSRIEPARRVVDAWMAIDADFYSPNCGDTKKTVAAINTLIAASTNPPIRRALAAALDEALVELADKIADIAHNDEDEEAAQ